MIDFSNKCGILKESKERRIFYVYQTGNLGVENLNRFSLDPLGLPFLLEDNMFRKGCIAWNKGKKHSKKTRRLLSIRAKESFANGRINWNKGVPCSEETKKKISQANTGNTWKLSKITKDKMRISKIANKNPNWKGEKVGYAALHNWIERHYGKPKKCSHCGTEVAKKYEWANISGKYVRDIKDFIRLCDRCHKVFDKKLR